MFANSALPNEMFRFTRESTTKKTKKRKKKKKNRERERRKRKKEKRTKKKGEKKQTGVFPTVIDNTQNGSKSM